MGLMIVHAIYRHAVRVRLYYEHPLTVLKRVTLNKLESDRNSINCYGLLDLLGQLECPHIQELLRGRKRTGRGGMGGKGE